MTEPLEPQFPLPPSAPVVMPPDNSIIPRVNAKRETSQKSQPTGALSRRAALSIAGVVVFGMAVGKQVFGPTPQERIATLRQRIAERDGTTPAPSQPVIASAGMLTNGMTPADLKTRKLVVGVLLTDLGITLGELVGAFDTFFHPSFEAIDANRFILRVAGTDPLTTTSVEYAFRFVVVDGPEAYGQRHTEFQGRAVVFDVLAYNRLTLPVDEAMGVITVLHSQALRNRRAMASGG
ncbi:hypothetical protein [Aureimonas psammosilenae]|uniref:hypothetical protein n=1 Tax=Aureimonas psammosilenae TaxID=2495496 RepID=UPI0012610CAA|nr:hypothetical protein [Aureimonas psammosilenae]